MQRYDIVHYRVLYHQSGIFHNTWGQLWQKHKADVEYSPAVRYNVSVGNVVIFRHKGSVVHYICRRIPCDRMDCDVYKLLSEKNLKFINIKHAESPDVKPGLSACLFCSVLLSKREINTQ